MSQPVYIEPLTSATATPADSHLSSTDGTDTASAPLLWHDQAPDTVVPALTGPDRVTEFDARPMIGYRPPAGHRSSGLLWMPDRGGIDPELAVSGLSGAPGFAFVEPGR